MIGFRLGHYLKTNLWFVPLLFVIGGILLSLVTTGIDDGTLIPQTISGDPAAALQVLYLISFAMLTLTGLALSLLLVVVQLAMGVFSPRVVRQVLEDRPSQVAIGLFAGTFSHSILSMRAVNSTPDGGTVPGIAVIVALVLAFACICTLVWYLNHIGQSVRVAAMVRWVADDTLTAMDRVYPDHGAVPDAGPNVIVAASGGIVFTLDHPGLVALAEKADCRFELIFALGDFVPSGAPLVRIVGDGRRVVHAKVLRLLALGPERTLNQDVAYGIRMLVDVAERSLSSGPYEDPTTAVQTIDRIHDVLRQLVRRPLHSGEWRDDAGVVRLVIPMVQWDGFVRIAFDELRVAGAASPQVSRRLRSALDDLLTVAPPDRRRALEEQIRLFKKDVAAVHRSRTDRRLAAEPDRAGIGSGPGLVSGIDTPVG